VKQTNKMKVERMKTPTIDDITPDIKSGVNAVLMTTALARAERERIDAIERDILSGAVYMADPDLLHRHENPKEYRITEPKEVYLMKASDQKDYFEEWQVRIDKLGRKLPKGHCPALIAEDLQRKAEHVLIEAAEPVFGVTRDMLWCSANGLENHRKYIDMLCGMVVNLPDFKNPLTGK
jgi:hypothetical protein